MADRGDWRIIDFVLAATLLVATAALFYWRLGYPDTPVFDETHYIPNGRAIFALEAMPLRAHPPFAQWLIGLSTHIGGDTPFSWRAAGAGLGVATVVCAFLLMRLLGFGAWTSAFGAGLTAINLSLMILARIAMLDVYALGFLALSALALAWSARPARGALGVGFWLAVSGLLLGLAAASKWSSGVYFALIWLGLVIACVIGPVDQKPSLDRPFMRSASFWPGRSLAAAALLQGGVALFIYALTFWPLLFLAEGARGPFDLVAVHADILNNVATSPPEHQDKSPFWKWPLMMEAVGFHFGESNRGGYEAIFYIGNPLIYWLGAYLAPICLTIAFARRDRGLLALCAAYFAFWLIWALNPRSLAFAYYYEPAATLLGPIIAAFGARVVTPRLRAVYVASIALGALALFAFFYPSVTAMHLERDGWTQYRWFDSWR